MRCPLHSCLEHQDDQRLDSEPDETLPIKPLHEVDHLKDEELVARVPAHREADIPRQLHPLPGPGPEVERGGELVALGAGLKSVVRSELVKRIMITHHK